MAVERRITVSALFDRWAATELQPRVLADGTRLGRKDAGKLRTASVLLSDVKQMFRFALIRDLVARNPLDTVRKREVGGPSVERDRVLAPDEIRQLARALPTSGLQPRFVSAAWIILSTGVRVGELIGAIWSSTGHDPAKLQIVAEASGVKLGFVDLSRRIWYLSETKNQRDHTIHLSSFAMRHFQRRWPRCAKSIHGGQVPRFLGCFLASAVRARSA